MICTSYYAAYYLSIINQYIYLLIYCTKFYISSCFLYTTQSNAACPAPAPVVTNTAVDFVECGLPLDNNSPPVASYTAIDKGNTPATADACDTACSVETNVVGFSFFDGPPTSCICWTDDPADGDSAIFTTDGVYGDATSNCGSVGGEGCGYTYCYGCLELRPSTQPSIQPSFSGVPSQEPSESPSISTSPSSQPSESPSLSTNPSSQPSESPSISANPSSQPSENPSSSTNPSSQPSESPSISTAPSSQPSENPSVSNWPTSQPSESPSISGQPSSIPSESPSVSAKPSSQPSENPSVSNWPTSQPSMNPSISGAPSSQVSENYIY